MKVQKDHSVAFAWFGIIGVAAFLIAWLCAASIDTAWEFGVNNLSELGISDTDAKFYFNYGCMITGALVVIFGFGHAVTAKNAGHTAGGAFLAIGGVLLALVGLITMDSESDLHNYVAISAALFIFFALIAITAGNWAADRKIFAGIGIVIAFMLAAMVFVYDVAEFSAYGIILGMIWFLAESVRMITSGKND
ncbi:MAG: DUF998 domain-containing protein [Candidatus Methanoplasma sp.]|jgi:hypothetical membrane protein|nr:DUF998 domain-containing protein [Candidatus Methanoplasma sp.]